MRSTTELSDLELLALWRTRETDASNRAGRELFRRYKKYLTRFFCNKTCGGDPADLVSQTFLELHRSRTVVEDNFRAFLTGIARNVFFNYLRSLSRRNRHIDRGELDFEQVSVQQLDGGSMSSLAARAQALRVFIQGLRAVSAESQVILELKYFEGMSEAELAETLGLPRTTVPRRILKAVDELRRHIEAVECPPDARSWDFAAQLAAWERDIRARLHAEAP